LKWSELWKRSVIADLRSVASRWTCDIISWFGVVISLRCENEYCFGAATLENVILDNGLV